MTETTRWKRPDLRSWLHEAGLILTRPDYTREVHRQRLITLIRYLAELQRRDPASFDIRTWFAASAGVEDPNGPRAAVVKARRDWPERWKAGQTLDCGTTACLMGHLLVAFPGDWGWSLSGLNVVGTFAGSPLAYSPTGAMERYFGLQASFWARTIYSSTEESFWFGKPDRVTIPDMIRLLCEALKIADQEVKPNPNQPQNGPIEIS